MTSSESHTSLYAVLCDASASHIIELFWLIRVLPHYCYNTIFMSETPKEVFLARWQGGVGQIPIVFRLAWGLCVFVCVCACVCGWVWATEIEIEREALDRGEVVFRGLRLAGWPLHNSSMEDRTSCLLQRLNSDTYTHTHTHTHIHTHTHFRYHQMSLTSWLLVLKVMCMSHTLW